MNKKNKEYRKAIADAFVKSLKEDPQHWKQMWSCNMRPINGHTGRKYSGLNRLWLQHMMYEKNYDDPRFYTFKQVQDMGLEVKKGSKAAQVEFWSLYDPELLQTLNDSDAQEYERKGIIALHYSVFNGSQIEGLEQYEQPTLSDAALQEAFDEIVKNMGVEIFHDGSKSAHYDWFTDCINLPKRRSFKSQDSYNATVLHELVHATGAEHRLNRRHWTSENFSEEEYYAKEELVTALALCFMQSDLGFSFKAEHFNDQKACGVLTEREKALMKEIKSMQKGISFGSPFLYELGFTLEAEYFNDHKACVQKWIGMISENEEALMEAIKEAEMISDYILKVKMRKREIGSVLLRDDQFVFEPTDTKEDIGGDFDE